MHKCDVVRSEKRQNRRRGKKFRFDEVHGRRQKTTERVGVPFGRTGFREIHPPLPTASVTITYALVATAQTFPSRGRFPGPPPPFRQAPQF